MSFTVRIELHKVQPGEDSYNILHNAMHEEGFTNTIRADNGKLFELPSAEYNYEAVSTNDDIYIKTQRACLKTGKSYWILISETARRKFLLKEL